jgi:hypothetical protein
MLRRREHPLALDIDSAALVRRIERAEQQAAATAQQQHRDDHQESGGTSPRIVQARRVQAGFLGIRAEVRVCV